MSQVDKAQVHDFTTGETVTEAILDQNTEVLRIAHNDTDNRVVVLENAQAGAMTGIRSGSAFPTNPVPKAGDKFYRTDQETEYTYSQAGAWEAIPFQKNTYTKTEVDTKFGAVFGKGAINLDSGFKIFTSGTYIIEANSSLYQQKDASNIAFKKAGLYEVELSCTRSDLFANQYWEIGFSINNDAGKMWTEKMVMGQYGWVQSGGPNQSQVPLHLSYMVRVSADDYINFNTSSQDGPRSYTMKFKVIRVSD
jgi:hypothetical protein